MIGRLADGTPYFAPLGEIPYDPDEDRVQCHLCGQWLRMIGSAHLSRGHGWTLAHYREAFALLKGEPTCARGTSEKLRSHTTERIRAGELRTGVRYNKPHGSGGRGVRRSRSLAVLRPELVLELHPRLNDALDPYRIGVRSGRKLWWQRTACGHVWDASPHERSGGRGCPRCARKAQRQQSPRPARTLTRCQASGFACRTAPIAEPRHRSVHARSRLPPAGVVALPAVRKRMEHRAGNPIPRQRMPAMRAPTNHGGPQPRATAKSRPSALSPANAPNWPASYTRPATASSIRSSWPRIQTSSSGGCARPAAASTHALPTPGGPPEAAPHVAGHDHALAGAAQLPILSSNGGPSAGFGTVMAARRVRRRSGGCSWRASTLRTRTRGWSPGDGRARRGPETRIRSCPRFPRRDWKRGKGVAQGPLA